MKDERKRHLSWSFLLGLAIPMALILSSYSFPAFFQYFETKLSDLYFASQRSSPALSTVAIVALDDETLERFNWRSKLNHRRHAELLEQLKREGARSVSFDFAFLEERDRDNAQHETFAKACRNFGKVILGAIVKENEEGFLGRVKEPLEILAQSAAGIGILFHPLDTDSVIRRARLRFNTGDRNYNALALETFIVAEGLSSKAVREAKGKLEIEYGADTLNIPLSPEGNILISYAGPANTVSHYSYGDVLDGDLPKGSLKDKVVFVGPTAKIFQDYRQVPAFSQGIGVASSMSGVEIHANTYLTIAEGLNGNGFLQKLPKLEVFFITLVCGVLVALSTTLVELYVAWTIPLILLPLYFILSHYFLLIQSKLMPPFTLPCLALILTYIAIVIQRYTEERKRRQRVRSMFEHFVPPHVVEKLENNPSLIQSTGQERELTVLFTDIRGFTSLAERIGAEKTVEILNRYFEVMTEVILRNEGMINKFMGDAILAVFGEPVSEGNHSDKAIETALEMRKALEELNENEEFQELIGPANDLDCGVAINRGKMFVGNIGSLKRKDYTVIGDAVNLCSRLEGLARGSNPRIIVSENTLKNSEKKLSTISLGEVSVKGKKKKVVAFGIRIDSRDSREGQSKVR